MPLEETTVKIEQVGKTNTARENRTKCVLHAKIDTFHE